MVIQEGGREGEPEESKDGRTRPEEDRATFYLAVSIENLCECATRYVVTRFWALTWPVAVLFVFRPQFGRLS